MLGATVCSLAVDLRLGAGTLGCLADSGTRSTGEAGTTFAFGDFDGDGLEDAAIGMPGCMARNPSGPDFEEVGAVLVCWGRAPDSNGKCGTADWSCTQLRDPVRDGGGDPVEWARFGQSLAAWAVGAHLTPSGGSGPRDQLIVGAPGFLDSVFDVRMGAVRGFVLQKGASPPINAWWTATSRLPQIPTLPAVGAPGPRYPETKGPPLADDDDSAAPSPPRPGTAAVAVDEGRVYVFHFASVFDEGPVLSVDIAAQDYATSETGPRGQWIEPGYPGLGSVHPLPAAPAPTGSPARFGAALGLHDIDCGGHPELFIGAPDTRRGTAIDDVVVARWEPTVAGFEDWFRIHRWEGIIGGDTERLQMVVAPTSSTSGYVYLWSDTNDAWAFEVIDSGDDDDSAAPPPGPCIAWPVNAVNLDGPTYGIPYSEPGEPLPSLGGCSGTFVPEPAWASPSGDRWARFGPPRALPLRGVDFGQPEGPVSIAQIDIHELGTTTGLFDLAATRAAQQGITLPPWPDPWLLDLQMQKVGLTTGPLDLCPSLTANTFPAPPPPSSLNGESFPDCGSLGGGTLGLNRWRLVPDPHPLTCDEPWIP